MCLQCFDRNQKALFARQVGCNNQTHIAVVKHCPQQRREGVPPESTHVDAGDDMLGLEFKSGPAFVIYPLGNKRTDTMEELRYGQRAGVHCCSGCGCAVFEGNVDATEWGRDEMCEVEWRQRCELIQPLTFNV